MLSIFVLLHSKEDKPERSTKTKVKQNADKDEITAKVYLRNFSDVFSYLQMRLIDKIWTLLGNKSPQKRWAWIPYCCWFEVLSHHKKSKSWREEGRPSPSNNRHAYLNWSCPVSIICFPHVHPFILLLFTKCVY